MGSCCDSCNKVDIVTRRMLTSQYKTLRGNLHKTVFCCFKRATDALLKKNQNLILLNIQFGGSSLFPGRFFPLDNDSYLELRSPVLPRPPSVEGPRRGRGCLSPGPTLSEVREEPEDRDSELPSLSLFLRLSISST